MRIAYACNNPDNGCDTGYSERVCISLSNGGYSDIELVGGRVKTETHLDPTDRSYRLQVGRLIVAATGYRYGYGNWCWDAIDVSDVSARRIFNYLMKLKHWHCEEGPDKLFEAFNARRRVNAVEWDLAREAKL